MNPQAPPREPIVSDEELVEAVAHCCNTRYPPVAKSSDIAELDFIEIEQQTVARRLQTLRDRKEVGGLKISRGWVWWIPEDPESDFDVDASSIYWEGIDPAGIPSEIVAQHPEFPDPGFWDNIQDRGESVVGTAGIPFLFGLGIVLLRGMQLPYLTIGRQLGDIGVLAFVGGISFIFLGSIITIGAGFGQQLAEHDLGKTLDGIASKLRRFF